jgi:hypothetical protein
MPSRYGIADFQYDVLARIIPGLFFIGLTVVLLAGFRSNPFPNVWHRILHKGTDWWLGTAVFVALVLLAYIIGQLVDCLTGHWIVKWFAVCQYRLQTRGDGNPRGSWSVIQDCAMVHCQNEPEYGTAGKAQAESRCLVYRPGFLGHGTEGNHAATSTAEQASFRAWAGVR